MSSLAVKAAREILERFGTNVPIDIASIVEVHNISIHEEDLEGTVSGVLMIKEGGADLAVNVNHLQSRQRFTMAHELGHFLLHKDQANVFIDESPPFFRDSKSSHGIHQREVEANAFAAELLMPEAVLRGDVETQPVDLNDDTMVRRMAARYEVSFLALSIRLARLGLVPE